jgi:hypothetical protein
MGNTKMQSKSGLIYFARKRRIFRLIEISNKMESKNRAKSGVFKK